MRKVIAAFLIIIMGGCSILDDLITEPNAQVSIQGEVSPYHFPIELYCEDVVAGAGPTWETITVGRSTVEDLSIVLFQKSDQYSMVSEANQIRFTHRNLYTENENVPRVVIACIVDNVVVALTISPSFSAFTRLADFVVQLGEPDVVTWSDSERSRVVFWFEHGIAAQVMVTGTEFGTIIEWIYMPFQSVSGFETRWPYNRTRNIPPLSGDEVFNPPLPTEQNPFDFDSIVATITAQPSRTPTPTFTVPPPTATATP